MKAIVYTRWGPPDVLELHDKEKPVPAPNQILLKVHASSVNAMEWRPFTMPSVFIRLIAGWREPRDKAFGGDVSGIVAAVGASVTRFRPGDEVFGLARGAYAEYVCTTEDKLALKPPNVSFDAAATVGVAGLTALQAVRTHGQVRPGERVAINGAGGGVGTFAVQVAKASGAEVTAVCSTRNQDVARAIGADHVIDYSREDFTAAGKQYDLIVAANGHHSVLAYRRALAPGGRLVVMMGALGTRQIAWSLNQCHVDTRLQTQLKFLGTYTVPGIDLQLAGTVVSSPGVELQANYVASNAVVQPSLGRSLTAAANAPVWLLPPGDSYGDRLNQVDFRVTKVLRMGRSRAAVNVDVYNALNANPVTAVNLNYTGNGSTWLQPQSILAARLVKVSVQFDY